MMRKRIPIIVQKIWRKLARKRTYGSVTLLLRVCNCDIPLNTFTKLNILTVDIIKHRPVIQVDQHRQRRRHLRPVVRLAVCRRADQGQATQRAAHAQGPETAGVWYWVTGAESLDSAIEYK